MRGVVFTLCFKISKLENMTKVISTVTLIIGAVGIGGMISYTISDNVVWYPLIGGWLSSVGVVVASLLLLKDGK